MILIAWIVEIVIGLVTRHILFLAAVSVVDAYLVFRLLRGRKGRSHAGSATP
jgi:membrane protein implicated in regulation of membrane protease activity